MTISMPLASAARNAAQLRALILGPVDGVRVPSISIAISRMLPLLFYLLAGTFTCRRALAGGPHPNVNSSNIMALCRHGAKLEGRHGTAVRRSNGGRTIGGRK